MTRADVLGAAAALADEHGLTGIRLQTLAEHLGVRAPSLYNYVASRDALVEELALRGVTELGAAIQAAAVGRSGPEAVAAISDAYRGYAHAHPGLYAAIQAAAGDVSPELRQATTELTVTVAAALREWSLEGDDAIHAVRGLRSALHGFVEIEAAGSFGMPIDVDESFRRLVATITAGLGRPVSPAGAPTS